MSSEIRSWRNVDRQIFEAEILPAARPAVLRGLVSDWPLVRMGQESPVAAAQYLHSANPRTQIDLLVAKSSIGGRFFYDESMTGFNFDRFKAGFGEVLGELIAQMPNPAPPALSMQAISVPEHLPGFEDGHRLDLVPSGTQPKIWIGNAITVAPHFDTYENIACVACGKRRFVLFPPEQVANLYVGPFEVAPQGVPISLVDVRKPDLAQFPRYQEALAAAQFADLEAGDAIYIPYMWWHGVQSISSFNVLVNYWWNTPPGSGEGPLRALVHAIVTITRLPPRQREIWKPFFDHYVFGTNGDPGQHIPHASRGMLGETTTAQAEQTLRALASVISNGRS